MANDAKGGASSRAYESKALAMALTRDAGLMEQYKDAAEEGLVRAVRIDNQNYTAVDDAGVNAKIRSVDPKLRSRAIDPPSA